MKLKKIIKHYVEYLFLFLITYILRLFPLKINLLIAKKLGQMLFYLDKEHRKRGANNLINAFPKKNNQELQRILKNVYINLAKVYVEFLFLPYLNQNYIEKNIRIVGGENLDDTLKLNKGIIGVSGHIGNWELLGTILVKKGYHLDAIYNPMRNPFSDQFINYIRKKTGIKLIPMKNPLRSCLNALQQNHILGLIADQDAGGDGVFVNFFNQSASTSKGPAVFAVKTKAPVIFFALIREKYDHHTLHISKPLNIKITGNAREDIYYNTKLWSDELEKWVRKYPEQWFWVHRKWHTRPKNNRIDRT